MPRYKPRSPRARAKTACPAEGSNAVILGHYRYTLSRWWASEVAAVGARVAWVMLNPSTADAVTDDKTITRVRGFSEAWGFSAFEVVNLFAYRTSKPAHLWSRKSDIVGKSNDVYLQQAFHNADRVVVAWGAAKDRRVEERVSAVVAMMRPYGIRAQCLGLNLDGSPRHPLYLAAKTKLEEWPPTASPSTDFSPLTYGRNGVE